MEKYLSSYVGEKSTQSSQINENPEPSSSTPSINNDKIPLLLNGKYFEITKKFENGNVDAKCCFCNQSYRGSVYATTNFLKHLKVLIVYVITNCQNLFNILNINCMFHESNSNTYL